MGRVEEIDYAVARYQGVTIATHKQARVLVDAHAQGLGVLRHHGSQPRKAASRPEMRIYNEVVARPGEAMRKLHNSLA